MDPSISVSFVHRIRLLRRHADVAHIRELPSGVWLALVAENTWELSG
jgi:hypothetical protein